MRRGNVLKFLLFVLIIAGCSYQPSPEYGTIRYAVTGTAVNVVITAVMDETGTTQTFSNVALPWVTSYTNVTSEPSPPVYLKVETTATPAPLTTGTADTLLAGHLVDSSADFVVTGIKVGDVARNPAGGAISAVTAVTQTDLTLTAGDDPFPTGTENYEIYMMRSATGIAYGDDTELKTLTLESWTVFSGTVIAYNYTAP
jgi:hypothetical protein